MQLNPGEVQLDIGGIILDVEASSVVDDIAFDNGSFTVTLSPGNTLNVSSAERRKLTVDPTTYVRVTSACTSARSSVSLETTQDSGAITITITPSTVNSCSTEGGGGGGGGGAGASGQLGTVAPSPALSPAPITAPPPSPAIVPTPAETPTPAIIPLAEEIPPAPVSPMPAVTAAIEVPPIITNAIQAAQSIGSGAAQIYNSVNAGINGIYRNITTGYSDSAYIDLKIPNENFYLWNTNKPLQPKINYPTFKLVEDSTYIVTVLLAENPNIQDSSENYFSFTESEISTSFTSPLRNFSLFNAAKTAFAQNPGDPRLTLLHPDGNEILEIGKIYKITWMSENIPPESEINLSISRKASFQAIAGQINKDAVEAVNKLRADPVVTQTIKQIAAPASAGAAVAGVGAITATAAASNAPLAITITEFLQNLGFARFYLLGLLRFKRKKPWGKVIDKFSGRPIQGAAIQIYDAEFNKLKDTQITDADGRFAAIIRAGNYYLNVYAKGFEPQEAKIIKIESPEQTLNLEISLFPAEKELSLETLKKLSVLNIVKKILDAINPYLLAFGTFVSIITVIIVPSALNYGLLYLYILLDALKIYFSIRLLKPFGSVKDKKTGAPVSLAIVRIFDADNNHLLTTKATDDRGRFNFLLTPGNYYLTCIKGGFSPYRSPEIYLKKAGIASIDITLNKII